MDILQTIALLCQLTGGTSTNIEQLNCQKYYIKCLNNDSLATYKTLSKCVLEKKF